MPFVIPKLARISVLFARIYYYLLAESVHFALEECAIILLFIIEPFHLAMPGHLALEPVAFVRHNFFGMIDILYEAFAILLAHVKGANVFFSRF